MKGRARTLALGKTSKANMACRKGGKVRSGGANEISNDSSIVYKSKHGKEMDFVTPACMIVIHWCLMSLGPAVSYVKEVNDCTLVVSLGTLRWTHSTHEKAQNQ
jgi:hypothetical protein